MSNDLRKIISALKKQEEQFGYLKKEVQKARKDSRETTLILNGFIEEFGKTKEETGLSVVKNENSIDTVMELLTEVKETQNSMVEDVGIIRKCVSKRYLKRVG